MYDLNLINDIAVRVPCSSWERRQAVSYLNPNNWDEALTMDGTSTGSYDGERTLLVHRSSTDISHTIEHWLNLMRDHTLDPRYLQWKIQRVVWPAERPLRTERRLLVRYAETRASVKTRLCSNNDTAIVIRVVPARATWFLVFLTMIPSRWYRPWGLKTVVRGEC